MFEFFYLWYLEDILRIVKGFPNVNFRHLIMPEEALKSSEIPIFDEIDVNFELIAQGEKDAKNVLNSFFAGEGHHYYFDELD
jgi:hypothetical protein